ncbi:MAG: OmpA family protein [Acidobacteriota bacterium]|nr:OmpA family protein [Acidobacteriota bacterium]
MLRIDRWDCKNCGRQFQATLALLLITLLTAGCSVIQQERQPYTTQRDKTAKGAGIGAAAGAAAAVLDGKREADEILAGAAIGAAIGGGVGFYMDRQEEKLARIPGTQVERVSEDTLLVHFDDEILFDLDSAVLGGSGRSTTAGLADVLHEFRKTAVVIQGHTDATGSEEHNQDLSERRAEAVRNALIGRGIDPDRMTAVGYGESAPVASNDTESGRQLNRRVDVLIKARAK